jgi:bacterioferritin-associated ferredoxin
VIVCHCRVVSDRAVRAAISDGAASVADVASACGAGSGCGGCVPSIEALLAEAALAVVSPQLVVERQRRRRVAAEAPVPVPAGA